MNNSSILRYARRRKVGGDTIAPTVVITSTETSPSYISPIPLTFTLSEVATDFVVGDIAVGAGGSIGNFSGSGTSYTADLTITTAAATVTVNVAANAFHDAAGNGNTAATQFSMTSALLLFDQFITADATPITTPRTCEPGPGTFVVTDTGSKAAIASGQLVFSGFTGGGNPALWGGLQTNAAGLAFGIGLRSDPNDAGYIYMGLDSNQAGIPITRMTYSPASQTITTLADGGYAPPFISPSLVRATMHKYLMIHRGSTAGLLFLVKPSGGSWTLAWPTNDDSSSALYPTVGMEYWESSNAYADNAKVVSLPAPLNTANGLATQALTGSRSQGDAFVHLGDCFIGFYNTTLPASGQHEIQFRKQDATNYWQVTIDSTGAIDLDEIVAGVTTQRGTGAGVVNGNRVIIQAIGTTIRVSIGAIGETQKINYTSASNFATSTDGSLLTLGASGAVSNIISWPRTITGAIATILDAVFP